MSAGTTKHEETERAKMKPRPDLLKLLARGADRLFAQTR